MNIFMESEKNDKCMEIKEKSVFVSKKFFYSNCFDEIWEVLGVVEN